MAISNPFKGMSKGQLYATIGGSAALGGFLLYKHHSSTGSWNPFSPGTAASSTTSSTQTDPVTGLPYSQDDATDPLTGLTYLTEAEQYGSVAAAEADVSQFGQSSATGSGIGVSPATGSGGTNTGTYTAEGYTSNAAWAQAAQAGLTDVGYDATTVGEALGAYLGRLPLSTAGSPSPYQIVNTAIAEYGPPPVGTFQVIQAPASGTGTTTPYKAPAAVASFSVTPHEGYADFGWGAVADADNYNLVITGPQNVNRDTGNVLNQEHVTLRPGRYTARVRANNHGSFGPFSVSRSFTVPGAINGTPPPPAAGKA